jgi:hypothetical protein
MIFYAFYKFQPNTYTIEDSVLPAGPWKLLQIHNYTLGSHTRPWKNFRPCNWVLWSGRRRSGLKSGEGALEFGRGSAEEGPRDHFGSVCALNWGRETDSELARRSRTAAAATSYGPGEDEAEGGNTR